MEALLSFFSALVMFSMGLDASPDALRRLKSNRAELVLAILVNVALLPLFGSWALSHTSLSIEHQTGLILCLLSAGGGTGSILTRLSKGDTVVSTVALLSTAVLSILVVPIGLPLVGLSSGNGGTTSLIGIGFWGPVLLFQFLPFAVGGVIAFFLPKLAAPIRSPASTLSGAGFFALVAAMAWNHGAQVLSIRGPAITAIALSALSAYAIGSWIPASSTPARKALIFSSGVRNLTAALFIAHLGFQSAAVINVILAYGLLMYFAGIPLSLYLRSRP